MFKDTELQERFNIIVDTFNNAPDFVQVMWFLESIEDNNTKQARDVIDAVWLLSNVIEKVLESKAMISKLG